MEQDDSSQITTSDKSRPQARAVDHSNLKVGIICTVLTSLLTIGLPKLYDYIVSGPKPIDLTPAELVKWMHDYKSPVQANAIAEKKYYGKYMEYTAPIEPIEQASNTTDAVVKMPNMSFFTSNQTAAEFHPSEIVTVKGYISTIFIWGDNEGVVKINGGSIERMKAKTRPDIL